jgi:hypothetical protein
VGSFASNAVIARCHASRRAPVGRALGEQGAHRLGDVKRRLLGPADGVLGERHLLRAEGLAVGLLAVLLVGRADADVGARDDQRRLAYVRHGPIEGGADLLVIVAVDVLHRPPVRLVARADVLGEREARGAVDGDAVVVVEEDQVVEAEVPREARRLGGDTLHQVAVGADAEHARRGDAARLPCASSQHAKRRGHADRVGDALTERARGGLDARREPRLGMPGRACPPLAKTLQLVEGQIEARHVEQPVKQHRGVAAGEDESISIGPARLLRVVAEMAGPDLERDGGERHGRAGVPGGRLLHAVHGEHLKGLHRLVDEASIELAHRNLLGFGPP